MSPEIPTIDGEDPTVRTTVTGGLVTGTGLVNPTEEGLRHSHYRFPVTCVFHLGSIDEGPKQEHRGLGRTGRERTEGERASSRKRVPTRSDSYLDGLDPGLGGSGVDEKGSLTVVPGRDCVDGG